MKFSIHILFIITFMLLFACKKEADLSVEDSIANTPAFSVSGTIDSTISIDYTAGVSNYFMYSNFYFNGDLFVFDSHLRKSGNAINNSIQILISSYDSVSNGADFQEDSIFYPFNFFSPFNDTSGNDELTSSTNRFIVRYFDDSGEKFTSSSGFVTDFLQFTEVNGFENNENGQLVKKIKFSLNASVKSTDSLNSPFRYLVLSGTFAFAYPN